MKKVKASRNKAAAVETKNTKLDNISSEDLGLLLGQQWQALTLAKGNIDAITQTLEKRKVKIND